MNWNLKKVLLAIPGPIILGAIGSGVWDVGMKPFGRLLIDSTLSVVSLGSSSIQNSIYKEAAKGNHEQASMILFDFGIGIIVLTLVISISKSLTSISNLNQLKHDFKVLPPVTLQPVVPPSVHTLRQELDTEYAKLIKERDEMAISFDQSSRRLTRLTYMLIIPISFSIGMIGILTLRQLASNYAYATFNQSYIICRPYLDQDKAFMLQSEFARIQSREDFLTVLNKLREIAKTNKVTVPDY